MAYLLAASLLWALSFGLMPRVAPLGPAFVAAVRSLLALAVFLPLARPRGLGLRAGAALAGLGAVQFGLMYVFYTAGFRYLQGSEAALFTVFTPLLVALAGDALDRTWSWRVLGVAALAAAGTAVCLGAKVRDHGILVGFLLIQASNACFALGQVGYRRLARDLGRPDRELMGLLYAGAALVTLALALPGLGAVPRPTPAQVAILAYLGLAASGLGFFLFNAGARRTNVGTLAVFNNAKIPLAILAAALVFGERVAWLRLAAGGSLIAGALLLAGRTRPGAQRK
ncbi:EamA family transporter [Mesoterricola sediminis]|uniref:Membrane protein n=1 Tax=Mesoterricola sediminis TaxID=2927980 RepID=A0AA48GQ72_9BACT|nr:EamA family transporter [Mesoterricola sediminis]BDU75549.1 membrane protein [Mesoterricola sediminis]